MAGLFDRRQPADDFPTALLMGMLTSRSASMCGPEVARGIAGGQAKRLGLFYSLNVVGGIVGSLLGQIVLLPQFGSRVSLIALAAVSFASGLLLLARSEARGTVRVSLTAVAAVAAIDGAAAPG